MTPQNYKPFILSELKIGHIIVFDSEKGNENATLTVINNVPITTNLYYGRHLGVYEGNTIVSDLVFTEKCYPVIRFMSLKERKQPTGIIETYL